MYLMHKNEIVAKVSFFDHRPMFVEEIYNKEELPVGLIGDETFASNNITEWNEKRTIPSGRVNLQDICKKTQHTPAELAIKSFGLSITDAYWYKPETSNLTWEDINFYDNGFIPDLLLLKNDDLDELHRSPDYTTNGCLEKYWIYQKGVAYLIKSGTLDGENPILAANEVIAYRIANRLDIPAVPYEKITLGEECYCICPSFIKNDEEFISLSQLEMQLNTHGDNFLIKKYLQEHGFQSYLDDILIMDVLLHNYDRHLDNCGLIRTISTGECRPCPIFDTGSSLNWNGYAKDENNMSLFERNIYDYVNTLVTEKPLPAVEELILIIDEVYTDFGLSEFQKNLAMMELQHGYNIISDHFPEKGRLIENIEIDDIEISE